MRGGTNVPPRIRCVSGVRRREFLRNGVLYVCFCVHTDDDRRNLEQRKPDEDSGNGVDDGDDNRRKRRRDQNDEEVYEQQFERIFNVDDFARLYGFPAVQKIRFDQRADPDEEGRQQGENYQACRPERERSR